MDIFELMNVVERVDVTGIQPKDLIRDNEVYIPKNLWLSLKETYTKEEIISLLNRAVDEYGIPFPYVEISKDKAQREYEDLLQVNSFSQFSLENWSCKKLKSDKWNFPFYNGQGVLLSRNYKGLKASDYFQNKVRMECGHARFVSPVYKWSNLRSRTSMWQPMWSLGMDYLDKDVCKKLINLRSYIASQFRPASAKAVYDVFKAKRVLDFCSGWGDRLCGFYASQSEEYVGIDPNSSLHIGYQKQSEFYKGTTNSDTPKKVRFICSPAEDADLSEYEEYFDLAFTSPPYFNAEKYCKEDTQSWIRYGNSPKSWLEEFLFKAIEKVWLSLRVGGRLVVNIADVQVSKNTYVDICHQMNNFIETLPNSHYEGVIGYELAQRIGKEHIVKGSKLDKNSFHKEKKPAEPMWVWSKGKQEPISFTEKEIWEF